MKNETVIESLSNVKKNLFSKTLVNTVEKKFLRTDLFIENDKKIEIGDIIKIGYRIPEGNNKERVQFYEGLVISIANRNLGKTFTIRRNVQGVGLEQIFLMNSPKIVSIVTKQSSKVRRAKLYFIRALRGKATRLKIKY